MKKILLRATLGTALILAVAIGCSPDAPFVLPLIGTVRISGNAQVGQTPTAVVSLGGSGSISYQWVRGETDIPGAT
jgi:hypothetical protein